MAVGKALASKCLEALFRVTALAFLVMLHKGIDWLGEWSFQHDYPGAVWVMRAVFLAAFGVVYAHEAWEMVTVFVPRLSLEPPGRKLEHEGKG